MANGRDLSMMLQLQTQETRALYLLAEVKIGDFDSRDGG